ncbi:ureidoglycolate lyase [Bradyrhizobium sp. HKCCYLS1011]|uniref:ureidoglycolate lyase n=1 Tax=Bradyrhizobium sp. HKCCYLS1011 TaxID=3420733 RepID=UPI003EB75BE4
MVEIKPEPLTKAAFARFGDVVEIDGAGPIEINQGFARRFNGLANIDVTSGGAAVNISWFEAKPRPQPIEIKLMERHPLGSQLFMPLQDKPWLVLVCDDPRDPSSYRTFTASGRQGVNYARNAWHHPLLVLGEGERFLVVDRLGADNLEEVWLDQPLSLMPK